MQLCRVKGTVVSTNKAEKLLGLKLLIVKPIDIETFEEKGSIVVAIDTVGAGEGEVVMCVGGSSSRQTAITDGKPVDQSIIAIIDSVDLNGERVFEKFKSWKFKS
ncbi:ethanolamine utilization protein EutN [Synergistales bacterium]|nr:ethanolamine utilization protein EutN [Synergistales bacterium]